MKINHHTLILVADGERATFFKNTSDSSVNLKALGDMQLDYLNDKGPSVLPVETSEKEIEEATHAKHIATDLYHRAHKGEFTQLVLIADPQTLGQIRPNLHGEVSDKLVCEIPKTLTNSPIEDIEATIAQELA